MNIVFRVDSSFDLGIGHVMRCITLADSLKKEGMDVRFICRKAKGDCIQLIKNNGFDVYELKPVDNSILLYMKKGWKQDVKETMEILNKFDVGILIIDHYAIDEKWEQEIRIYTNKIVVIDDIADRSHVCDILIDQNYYENASDRYTSNVSERCELLLGPIYALLRPEFASTRMKMKQRNGIVKSIMISFGGSDPSNETMKVLLAIQDQKQFEVHVVVGQSNIFKEEIKKFCINYPHLHYYCQIDEMADLMSKCDLAIGAGGSTSWERCCLGLPSIIVSTAENQVELAKNIAKVSVTHYLGDAQNIGITEWRDKILTVINSEAKLVEMSCSGMKLVDGLGAERVVKAILQ